MPLTILDCWSHHQVFDRGSFGVGALTTNRYQPPEKVGDPLPSRQPPTGAGAGGAAAGSGYDRQAPLQFAAVPPAGGAAAAAGAPSGAPGGGRGYASRMGAAAGGRGAGAAAAAGGRGAAAMAAGGASQSHSQAFMPFAMPSYSIPLPAGRSKVRYGPRPYLAGPASLCGHAASNALCLERLGGRAVEHSAPVSVLASRRATQAPLGL